MRKLVKRGKRYNQWAGNPKGVAYDPERCSSHVHDRISFHFYQ